MHLNHDESQPAGLPCIRDMHELLRDHLPPLLVKWSPLPELDRRLQEITAEHPRFREEAPLVLQGETARRRRLSGEFTYTSNQLHVA